METMTKSTQIKGDLFCGLTDKGRPNAPTDPLPALGRKLRVGEVYQSMTVAKQTIAVIITFRE